MESLLPKYNHTLLSIFSQLVLQYNVCIHWGKPWTLDGLYNPNLVVHPSYYQWVSSSQLQLDWTYLPYLQLG